MKVLRVVVLIILMLIIIPHDLILAFLADLESEEQMAKKKFKFEYKGLEITSSNVMDFQELIKLFSYAALWQRHLQHIKECNEFEILADDVLKKIKEQIIAEV